MTRQDLALLLVRRPDSIPVLLIAVYRHVKPVLSNTGSPSITTSSASSYRVESLSMEMPFYGLHV